MVTYPPRPPKDPFVADLLRNPPRPSLEFRRLDGEFVTDHTSRRPITVTQVLGYGTPRALIYKTPIHEDWDGDPEAYAAPISAANLRPRGGVMHETSLKNATDEKDPQPVFQNPPAINTFHWEGAKSRASTAWDIAGEAPGLKAAAAGPNPGNVIDFRPFLQDADGNFPIFRRGTDFYRPRTAFNDARGNAVDATTVPYGALSALLRDKGRVSLGDVGLAIRVSTGAATPFLFADAGGRTSNAVGEYSVRLVRLLFNGPPTDEAISFIVFPRSAAETHFAMPEKNPNVLHHELGGLAAYANAAEIVDRLSQPHFGDPLFAGRTFLPPAGRRTPLKDALANEDSRAWVNVELALRDAGLSLVTAA
jgi:hypothetical protein